MIQSQVTAAAVHEQVLKASDALNQALRLVQESGSEQEFSNFRTSTGKVLGEIFFEILTPLYALHPGLMPPEINAP